MKKKKKISSISSCIIILREFFFSVRRRRRLNRKNFPKCWAVVTRFHDVCEFFFFFNFLLSKFIYFSSFWTATKTEFQATRKNRLFIARVLVSSSSSLLSFSWDLFEFLCVVFQGIINNKNQCDKPLRFFFFFHCCWCVLCWYMCSRGKINAQCE